MLKGADIVLQCLRAEGVDLVFGYPGGAIMPLYDALHGSGVRHSGPGATNLVTGIADAKMDSVPLVCITGQVRSPLIGTDAFQETDVFGLTLSLTKWSRLVKTAVLLLYTVILLELASRAYWAFTRDWRN